MPTLDIYADASDGKIRSENATYLTARSGSGLIVLDVASVSNINATGQAWDPASVTYKCYEAFFSFDFSGIPANATITSVTFYLTSAGSLETNCTLEARAKDWGATLDTGDWVAGANLGSQTLLASYATSLGWTASTEYQFTSDAAFVAAAQAAIGSALRFLVTSDRLRAGTAPSTSAGADDEAAGLYWADEGGSSRPRLSITYTIPTPTTVHRRRRSELAPVHFSVAGEVVDAADDWSMTTVANGGYDTLRCRMSHRRARQLSALDQGAIVAAHIGSHQIWEGKLGKPPLIRDGQVFIGAAGHKSVVEKNNSRLFYQSADLGLITSEASSPIEGTPIQGIAVTQDGGGIAVHYAGGTAVNGTHKLVINVPGGRLSKVQYDLLVQGTTTGWTVAGATPTTGAKSHTITGAPDTYEISVTSSGASTVPLSLFFRNWRINGLTANDSEESSAIVADVGQRCGYDVSGVPTGIGTNLRTLVPIYYRRRERGEPFRPFDEDPLYKVVWETAETGVETSSLNVLPLDWQASWADLLTYMGLFEDRLWRVLGNLAGSGPVLEYGTWPRRVVYVSLADSGTDNLDTEPVFNAVNVKYRNRAGQPAEFFQRANPDPLSKTNDTNVYLIELQDRQISDTLAQSIAALVMPRVTSRRMAGTLEVNAAHDGVGPIDPREILAGDVVVPEDFAAPYELRITETAPHSAGNSLGVGQPINIASVVELYEKNQQRRAFGVL